MFTYIRLKNFMSFGEVTFNFKKSENSESAKSFVALYGENGSGKSNFVRSIALLCHTLTSFDRAKQVAPLSELIQKSGKNFYNEIMEVLLRDSDMEHYISTCRTIDCEEPTEVEYGFLLNGYEGVYRISFEKKFINESLYYFTGKQRGYLFNISVDSNDVISWKFNSGLFLSNNAKNEVIEEIKKYWGKHTFLGILKQLIRERNAGYIKGSFSEYLLSVITMFREITLVNKESNRHNTGVFCRKPGNILRDLRSGEIEKSQLPLLDRSERILRDFFTQTYADIKDVAYEKMDTEKNRIKYQLYVEKMIAGRVRRISFENESAGTQQVLEIVRVLLGLFCGVTVVYDEIDNGIHDVLLNQIIHSLAGEINGQLIITTHNTMLLEEMNPNSAYVIQVDYAGNKEIHCMAEFVQSNNNTRKQYVKGMFGGTPYIDGIDYDTIVMELDKEGKTEEEDEWPSP